MIAIRALSHQHSISTLCRVLKVNRSTYYKFLNHRPSAREIENTEIRSRILEIYAASDKRLGAHKIQICLQRDYCIHIIVGRVYRLMKTMNLPKMSTIKPPRPRHFSQNIACENILAQNFDQPEPNLVWVSDFTYLRVAGRFYYLCVILDLFSRKVIAYRVSPKMDRFLAIDTLRDAVAARNPSPGLIFHSDRGSQFTSDDFRRVLDEFHFVQSFSAKGHPYDNAVVECFFKYLKKEETDRRSYQSLDQLKRSLFSYINGFYNSLRPHSHNRDLSPIQRENLFFS